MELKTRASLLLLDGNALIHRAFHALPPLTVSRTGEMVNAVYGFTSTLLKALREMEATYCVVAFDYPAPTFRKKIFEEYKAQRPRTPSELVGQIIRSHQVVEAFNIPIFEVSGFEADDILGTLSRQANNAKGVETTIITADNDMLQLVSPDVRVYVPGRKFNDAVLYDSEMIKKKWGVDPQAIPDLKALTGDVSDNVPGVSGIGQKTAARLLQQFGTVEEIYSRIEEVAPQRIRDALLLGKDQVLLGKELTTIVRDVPISLNLEECRINNYDRAAVFNLFQDLEFARLLNRLPQNLGEQELHRSPHPFYPGEQSVVEDEMALQRAIDSINTAKEFVIRVDLGEGNVHGLTISPFQDKLFYIPLEIGKLPFNCMSLREVAARIKLVVEDPSRGKISYDAKQLLSLLASQGIEIKNLSFDVIIAAHLLGEKKLSLEEITFNKLGFEMKPGSNREKRVSLIDSLSVDEIVEYAATSAGVIWELKSKLQEEINQKELEKVFYEIELPLVQVLVEMERNGIALDIGLLRDLSHNLQRDILTLEAKIYDSVGYCFNINSPRQLGEVLFQGLNLPSGRKTKTGYSTEARILESLKGVHPVVDLVLQYRQLSKLKSTYVDALPALVNRETGRIYTTLSQVSTATGRISSVEPNLQNIPTRTELGGKIRQAFIASPGHVLLSADYSQIDLRVLAHLSQDEGLVASFVNDEDIHRATASRLFNVALEDVTPEMRYNAKRVNFGVVYGMSSYGLEQATNFSLAEASEFIALYFDRYPGVKKYLEGTKERARKLGYVQTLKGRRRLLPEINSPNRMIREAAERMAINAPVQGTSADIIKIAMLNLYDEMKRRTMQSKMLLQIHDELLFEVPEGEIDVMCSLANEIMAHAVGLCVPLKVSLKAGKNWGELA